MVRKSTKDEYSSDDENLGEEEDGPPTVDPYEVLGLEREATADDVKKSYRKMALKHHPGMFCVAFV
jgi:DnaJ homolog subfamily C member 9